MTYGHWHGAMAGGRSERKMEMKGSPKGLVSLTQLQVVLVDGQLQKQSPIFFFILESIPCRPARTGKSIHRSPFRPGEQEDLSRWPKYEKGNIALTDLPISDTSRSTCVG